MSCSVPVEVSKKIPPSREIGKVDGSNSLSSYLTKSSAPLGSTTIESTGKEVPGGTFYTPGEARPATSSTSPPASAPAVLIAEEC